ncbi:hypothetical protein NFI96_000098 [Prochilodus magdalenae]|nr:hypothetical protein NFI96_000098 [Prochilodus magdalenae]
MLDRSHRSLLPTPRHDEQRRAIVARLHYFRDCAKILLLAREKQRIKLDGMIISIYPDFTVRVATRDDSFGAQMRFDMLVLLERVLAISQVVREGVQARL